MTDLDALIRQAEMQQQQLKLELQFKKNMELFQKYAPVICEEYSNYQPTHLQLSFDQNGYLNLVNKKTGNPVYNADPQEFCHEQVSRFAENPRRIGINYNPTTGNFFFQYPLVQKILDRMDQSPLQATPSVKKPIGLMVVNGCGLGYHIREIVETMDVYTLCICDPHKDSFYASLHVIDWEPIVRYCYRKGRLLKLYIGSTEENTITSLRLLANRIGLQNISNTFVYTHLSSDVNDSFSKSLLNQFHLTLTGTGFLEDEQVSIAHTVGNLNNGASVLNNHSVSKPLPPAFIVGNGPSLDGLVDTLKQQAPGAVIFSCGSTSGTLCQLGIVPDFHIEMERTAITEQEIRNGTTAEFRAKVRVLALNTVSPDSLALFKEAYIAKKKNDAGEVIIEHEFEEDLPSLTLCNPTCTNTGLAFALRMGFKEIYLLGVDLGMADESQHHSKASLYYSEDENTRLTIPESQQSAPITVKGNFGGTVKTTSVLDTSRANFEVLLKQVNDVRTFNLNHGALIHGATPMEAQQLSLPEIGDKQAITNELTVACFTTPTLDKQLNDTLLKQKYLSRFRSFKSKIRLPKKIDSIALLQQQMDEIHLDILSLKTSDPLVYWLLNGSTQTFFTLIMKSCLAAVSDEELKRSYSDLNAIYEDFIGRAFDLINNDLLKPHSMDAVHE